MGFSIAENACRVCLEEQNIMINLFDTVEDFQKLRLSDLLENCSGLKIEKTDNFPKLICDECTGELLVAAKFRDKCKRTQKILAQVQETSVKFDIPEIEENPVGSDLIEEVEEIGDIDNFIVEEHDTELDNEIEFERNSGDQDMIIEEVFVDDEVQDEEIVLFAPEVNDERLLSKGSDEDEQMQLRCDDQVPYEGVVNAANISEDTTEEKDKTELCNDKSDEVEDCGIVTGSHLKSTEHSIVAMKPLIINCICDVCGAGFTHVNNLTRHIQSHNTEHIYMCTVCKHPFSKFALLQEHWNEHVNDFTDMKKEVVGEENYEVKREIVEIAENPSKIKVVLMPTELENPPAPHGEKKKARICSICSKPFVSKSALEAHMRIHTGDKPFKCDKCSKSFTTQGGLALHLRRHSGLRPFRCDVCDRCFGESSNLRVHMRIHTGEKPHKCTICNRSFARVFLLQIHLRTHTGERPFQCPFCEKAFAQGGDLASHKRIHTGERPHVCRYCKKGFIKSSGLTQHMRGKHTKLELEANRDLYDDDKRSKNDNFDICFVEDDVNNLRSENEDEDEDENIKDDRMKEDYLIELPNDNET